MTQIPRFFSSRKICFSKVRIMYSGKSIRNIYRSSWAAAKQVRIDFTRATFWKAFPRTINSMQISRYFLCIEFKVADTTYTNICVRNVYIYVYVKKLWSFHPSIQKYSITLERIKIYLSPERTQVFLNEPYPTVDVLQPRFYLVP